MKLHVIHNTGSGLDKNSEDAPDRLKELFRKHGAETEFRQSDGPDVQTAARQARSSGADVVVIAGGDGSVSAVAGELAGSGIPMGVIPMGTFNNFAKDAGIPLDAEEAVMAVLHGRRRPIDLGEVNGRVFINNSSIGLYPRAVRQREKILGSIGGRKTQAMFIAAFAVFKRFPKIRVRLQVNDVDLELKSPFVFVGNNEYETTLPNLGGRKSLEGGRLSLYTIKSKTRLSMLRVAFANLAQRADEEPDFELHTAREIRLDTRKRSAHVSLDGEIVLMETPLDYRIRPRDLVIVAP